MNTARQVVFISHSTRVSGAEVVLLDLIRHGCAHGWQVTLICPRGDLRDALPAACAWQPIPTIALTGQTGVRRVLAFLVMIVKWSYAATVFRRGTRHADAVVINSTHALPAWALSGRRRTAVWLVHDVIDTTKRRTYARLARPMLARSVTLTLAPECGQALRDLGIPTSQLPLGVNITTNVPRPPSSPPTVGMLAMLTRWKAQDTVIKAIAVLPDLRLELAGEAFPGDEAYLAELRELVRTSGASDRVDFIGRVAREDVLGRWDALVCASRDRENGPLAALEAMASAVPVVTSTSGRGHIPVEDVWSFPDDDVDRLASALRAATTAGDERTARTLRAHEFVAHTHNRRHTVAATFDAVVRTEDL